MSSKYQFADFLQDYDANIWHFKNDSKLIKTDSPYNADQRLFLSNKEDFLIILMSNNIKILDSRDFSTLSEIFNSSFRQGSCFMI